MAGRPRLPASTFGQIKTAKVDSRRFRAWSRYRDWDGQTRQVTERGPSTTPPPEREHAASEDAIRTSGLNIAEFPVRFVSLNP